MIKNLKRIPTPNLSPNALQTLRAQLIGGADASIIAGHNPYESPYSLYTRKLGLVPSRAETEAMRMGRDLEKYVAERFCMETGKRVRKSNAIYQNDAYPFAYASIDRLVMGEDAGLECKTTSAFQLRKFKNGSFPEADYAKCLHHMAVTGCARWYLAVLVLGSGFYHYTIDRDEGEITQLMAKEKAFDQQLREKNPPDLDGHASTSDILALQYETAEKGAIFLPNMDETIDQYVAYKHQIKTIEIKAEQIKQKLQLALGTHEEALTPKYKVLWKNRQRKTFQLNALVKAYPSLALDDFYLHSAYRAFDVKPLQGDENHGG